LQVYFTTTLITVKGQERYASINRIFYRDAVAAFVVYDVTRKSSFEAVTKWKADIDSKVFLYDSDIPIPCVLLANKSDLVGWIPQSEEFLERFCVENKFVSWFPTSAKKNINIEEAVMFLVSKILKNQKLDRGDYVKDLDIIRLNDKDKLKGLTFHSCVCV
jgi:Ras-related protein Rab-32